MTSGPVAPFFPAGYGPQPSDFDTWVQAPLAALTGKVVFRAERAGALSLSTNVSPGAVVPFDSILEDPYSGWSPGADAWTAPWSGWYAVHFSASAGSVSGGELRPRIVLAASTNVQWEGSSSWTVTSGLTIACLEAPMVFIGGTDAVSFRIDCQASAGSFTVGTNAGQRCQAEVIWIGS